MLGCCCGTLVTQKSAKIVIVSILFLTRQWQGSAPGILLIFEKNLGHKFADNFTNTPAHERVAMKVESTRASPELQSVNEDGGRVE